MDILRKKMKKLSLSITIFVVVCAAFFWASPYWMLYQIHQGIEQNQAEKISKYIDFPSVRESLKPQIKDQIDQQLGLSKNHRKIELFGFNLTEQIADKTVDLAVTPQTVNLLLQGKQLRESIEFPNLDSAKQIFQPDQISQLNSKVETTTHQRNESIKEKSIFDNVRYISWNKFEVKIDGQVQPTSYQNRFIFEREGFSWKMKEIYLK